MSVAIGVDIGVNKETALKEASNAVRILGTAKPFLSKADKETLSILVDKELMGILSKSLKEEKENKVESLESILY